MNSLICVIVGNITDWIFERTNNYTCGGADEESVLFNSVVTKKGVEKLEEIYENKTFDNKI